ncbi:MAG: hypothetical protein ACXAEU_06945 [Candidatus Hodarchaeales archaeon]
MNEDHGKNDKALQQIDRDQVKLFPIIGSAAISKGRGIYAGSPGE